MPRIPLFKDSTTEQIPRGSNLLVVFDSRVRMVQCGSHHLCRMAEDGWSGALQCQRPPADGIIDFKLDETTDPAQNLIRIRTLRNVGFGGRWHKLKIAENREVTIAR